MKTRSSAASAATKNKPAEAGDPASGPRLWLVLARAYGSLAAYVEQIVAEEGLGLTDFMVLEALLHKGSMTISEIGQRVLLAAPSMTSAIDRLERQGYVVRRPHKEDRRIRLVELTPTGRRFIAPLYERHARSLESVADALSRSEKDRLRGLLKKLGLAAEARLGDHPGA